MKKITFTLLMLVCLLALVGCGHEHQYTEKKVDATCTEKGYTEYTCECGDTYKDNEVAALGHNYSDWKVVKEATEEEKGSKEKVCSVCNDKVTEEIPVLEHVHKYTEKKVDATCTEKGYTEHTCECGDKYTDNEVDKKEHSYGDWEVLKEATQTEDGSKERTCSVCNKNEQESFKFGESPNQYKIELVTNKEKVQWPTKAAADREEILDELFKDLYEWAQMNGETKSYEDYIADVSKKFNNGSDVKFRNTSLGNVPAEDGSTNYFLNIPKYYEKWGKFFEVFNEAMLKVNGNQNFYTDTYAAMKRIGQFISWDASGKKYFESYLPQFCELTRIALPVATSYMLGEEVDLPVLSLKNGLDFLGWYDNAELTGNPITKITATDKGNKTFYAKWEAETKVEKLDINMVDELLLFTTHQLQWTISPEDATEKEIEFFSSNKDVATINSKGFITALANGKTTITIKVYGNRELDMTVELTVYIDSYINASYESASYVEKGGKVKLLAEVIRKDFTTAKPSWSSLTPEIATVDQNGEVNAVAEGIAKIVASDPQDANLKFEFVVVVVDKMPTGILDLALRSNVSNVFTRYDLNIGGEYNTDIFGSVSKLLANSPLNKNSNYYATSNKTTATYGTMQSIEFITVHYTGNMASGSTAKANANYFANSSSVSIHYTTGNDGVYYCLDETQAAWHAGDSGALKQVGEFKWIPTGVNVKSADPMYPVFTISNDFYYEINGTKTTVKVPKPWNYDGRNTDHTFNSDGTISSKSSYSYPFTNRPAESFINDQGLPFKIVNGQYYMGTTWWCYTQVHEGRICSTGGNRNSIGIESCVNEGSDLWWTWQKTAQLVADIMERNKLDITRVRGHHFYSAKNCPQPMLENDMEIWWEFLELVEAEYELLTKYKGYTVSIKSNNPDIVDDNGRIIKQPNQTTCVTYTMTLSNGTDTQSITLASIIKGMYVGR